MSVGLARALVLLVVVAWLLPLSGCPAPLTGDGTRAGEGATTLRVFLGDLHVATVREQKSGAVVERESRLVGASDDVARLRVTLDERGFVSSARYRRTGSRGEREVTLEHTGGVTTLRTSNGSYEIARERPVVFLETLHHLSLERPAAVAFVDVTAGEVLPGSVRYERRSVVALDEHGDVIARAHTAPVERVGPGRFVERTGASSSAPLVLHPPLGTFPGSTRAVRLRGLEGLSSGALALDGPGQRADRDLVVRFDAAFQDTTPPRAADRAPAPFLESDDEGVRAFAERHARAGVPSADALALANAIHAELDTSGGGGPPSAVRTLATRAGDCDDATALLVAALRARGHPARPVVGYRHHDGELVPHAWAEVYDGRAWLPVDALVPGLGPFASHLRLFEGLGSSLTMGRVLGALQIAPAPALDSETRETAAR